MSVFLDPKYASLTAYVPGEQPRDRRYVKLNTNESPYPPSPGVLRAVAEAAGSLNLYPDPEALVFRRKLAEKYGVPPEMVLAGNGSDELLAFAFQAFCKDGAVMPDVSYGFYPVFAALYGVRAEIVPLREDFTLDLRDFAGKRGMAVFANPNAPTGLCVSPGEVEALLKADPGRVVLVDEAYVDFGGTSCVPLIGKYPNLLVVGTFSKSRSLAGGRLGYALGDPGLISDLNLVKYAFNPYNVNRISLAAGAAALDDDGYYAANSQTVAETREYARQKLLELGFVCTDSKANFLFAKNAKIGGEALYRALKAKGVLVRHFAKPRLSDWVRVTVGSREQMDVLIDRIKEIL